MQLRINNTAHFCQYSNRMKISSSTAESQRENIVRHVSLIIAMPVIIGKLITPVVLLTSDLINSIIKIAYIKSAEREGAVARGFIRFQKSTAELTPQREAVGFNVNHSEFYEMYRWHAPRSNAPKNILRPSRSRCDANRPPN